MLRRLVQQSAARFGLRGVRALVGTAHATPVPTQAALVQCGWRYATASGFDANPLHKKLHELIHQGRIVVFLTGTPEEPRCGFTARIVDLLAQLPIQYTPVNILDDDEVCEGLKSYSNWPTYPQVYIDGELIGGFDITRKMLLDGSLPKLLKEKKLLQ